MRSTDRSGVDEPSTGNIGCDPLIDCIDIPLLECEADGTVSSVNQAAERFLGRNAAAVVGTNIVDLAHREDRARLAESLRETGKPWTCAVRLACGDSPVNTVRFSYSGRMMPRGKLLITATEPSTADKLDERLQEYRAALDQNPLSIVLIGSTGTIDYVNPAFESMHGCRSEEVIGKQYSVLKSEYLSEDQYSAIERTILTGREWRGEFQNKRNDGEVYWEYAIVFPIKRENGALRHCLILSEDITERKKAEHELIAAKERARRADRIKEAFLGNISHEIRTPLNIILGYTELLQATMESQEAEGGREFLTEIIRASQRLMRTVDDIIHVTRIDVGDYSFEKKRIDVVAEVYQLVMEMMLFAREKNIHLDFTPGCGSLFVEVEPVTFLDAIANLIDNAIKFTREGFVVVDIQRIDDTAVIRVQDTGVGMSESFVEDLFTPFSQEDSGSQRSFEGLGLGLALTKKYLNLNGAEIAVKSVKGRGTLFTVCLPALD